MSNFKKIGKDSKMLRMRKGNEFKGTCSCRLLSCGIKVDEHIEVRSEKWAVTYHSDRCLHRRQHAESVLTASHYLGSGIRNCYLRFKCAFELLLLFNVIKLVANCYFRLLFLKYPPFQQENFPESQHKHLYSCCVDYSTEIDQIEIATSTFSESQIAE